MLSHLRLLDLTDGGASMAGRMLADLGADVVLDEVVAAWTSQHDVEDLEDDEITELIIAGAIE